MRPAPLLLLLLLATFASAQPLRNPASAPSNGSECDDGGVHHEAVLRVQEADGSVRGEVRTGLWYPPCSRPPEAAFSGRWVAYRDANRAEPLRILDWTTGSEHPGNGVLPDDISRLHWFGLVNDTLVDLDQETGVARWLDLTTGASGHLPGLAGYWLADGMAVAIQEAQLRVTDVRQGTQVVAVPLETAPIVVHDVLSSNVAYTVVYDNATGEVGLVHHATGAMELLVRYDGVSAGYLGDGYVAIEIGPSRFRPWGQEPVHVYSEAFRDGPTQVIHADGRLWGHSKGLYLVVDREASQGEAPLPVADPDEVIEIPSYSVGLAVLAVAMVGARRRFA